MKRNSGMRLLAGLVPALSVGGCSGGGTNDFVSFATLARPSSTMLGGVTRESSYTASAPFTVSNVSPASEDTGIVTLTVDAAGLVTGIVIQGAQSAVVFSNVNGSTITSNAGVTTALSSDRKNFALGADFNTLGFNYQTFGAWLTGAGTGSGNIGAISAGASTPNSSVPTTGAAVYNGSAGGIYVDASGATFVAASSAALSADFANHTVSYSTSGSTAIDSATGAALLDPSVLNMHGTLTLASGSNSFSGPVSTSILNGTASGRFYGPVANEVGGTFALKGAGVSGYLGAFGAK